MNPSDGRAAPGAPPFRLPGTHFVGALLWLVLGGVGLVIVAPDLAEVRFLQPHVFAVTHLYTLGVIVASVFGALYQYYPLSLGAGARSIRLGVAGGWLLHAGIAALVTGFWFWRPALQAAGWLLLFLAIGCVSWNLLPHRRRMTQGRRAAGYVSAAHAMLGFALFIAGGRIGESLGWWSLDRLSAIAAHFHLAAFGFAGLTAVGVGGRMLPMFLVSGPGPDWPIRAIGPTGSVGLLALAVGLLGGVAPLVWLGALLGVAAAAIFIGLVARHFRRRLRRALEPAFGHVLVGFASLVLALGLGIAQLAVPGIWLRGWVIYAELILLGWLVIFITGIWYRLFVALIWLHFYRGSAGASVRTPAELVHRSMAWTSLALLGGGVLLLVAGTGLASAVAARVGAAGVLGGSLLIAAQYVRIYAGRNSALTPVRTAGVTTGFGFLS
ncbi:MAG TPA: hypothetical protein VJU17_09735 [Gemmatimonadales bacterium]|nr:hypothetical protein [Gemmatimonadales bacterium]